MSRCKKLIFPLSSIAFERALFPLRQAFFSGTNRAAKTLLFLPFFRRSPRPPSSPLLGKVLFRATLPLFPSRFAIFFQFSMAKGGLFFRSSRSPFPFPRNAFFFPQHSSPPMPRTSQIPLSMRTLMVPFSFPLLQKWYFFFFLQNGQPRIIQVTRFLSFPGP